MRCTLTDSSGSSTEHRLLKPMVGIGEQLEDYCNSPWKIKMEVWTSMMAVETVKSCHFLNIYIQLLVVWECKSLQGDSKDFHLRNCKFVVVDYWVKENCKMKAWDVENQMERPVGSSVLDTWSLWLLNEDNEWAGESRAWNSGEDWRRLRNLAVTHKWLVFQHKKLNEINTFLLSDKIE